MPGHKNSLRAALISVAMLIAFCALIVATWNVVAPASSPLNWFASEPWPAVPRASRPLTLEPNLFEGKVAEAYGVAKQRPELLERIACYCECYLTAGHQNALDCFRDRHAAGCETCVAIALRAEELGRRGYAVADVKAIVDREYARKPRR